MPKVTFNQLVESIRGKVGNMVFYQADGQSLSRKAPESTPERTVRQAANSVRFAAAQKYAREALADPALKAAYKAICRGHQNPRNLAIRDAMRPPVVGLIDMAAYTGKPGQVIRVEATDDFRVVQVQITVRGPEGEMIEEGLAEFKGDGANWLYAAKAEVPPGQTVSVTAVAKDSPGNTGECQRWQYLPAAAPLLGESPQSNPNTQGGIGLGSAS